MNIIFFWIPFVIFVASSVRVEVKFDREFSGRSCVTMPEGHEDCVASNDRLEYEQLKQEQSARRDASLRDILKRDGIPDELIPLFIEHLKARGLY